MTVILRKSSWRIIIHSNATILSDCCTRIQKAAVPVDFVSEHMHRLVQSDMNAFIRSLNPLDISNALQAKTEIVRHHN